MRLRFLVLSLSVALSATTSAAQQPRQGAIVGVVVSDDGRALGGARIDATRRDGAPGAETSSDVRGAFRLGALAAGVYSLTVRQLGFRPAELPAVRLVPGDTVRVRVTLTREPTLLSSVVVLRSPTTIDALTPESPRRVDRETALLLPTPRDASSLVALVPGAKDGRLWGSAGTVTNDFKVDGVSMNHPGAGGDVLQLSRDWIEALEIRGLGANAEFGNFQGGVVNAITRTGTNRRTASVRAFHESEALTATNFDLDEQGAEQAERTEVSGELSGPIVRDRLFYFVGGQADRREFRAPDLASAARRDFMRDRETRRELRGIGKVTWLRSAGERVDLLLGSTVRNTSNAGINGLDAVSALPRMSAPTLWYEAGWRRDLSSRTSLELKLAGFDAHERRLGSAGADVPAVRPLSAGDLPRAQNAEFDARSDPASTSLTLVARHAGRALGAEHAFSWGAEVTSGSWRDSRVRNGGLTWRPFVTATAPYSPTDASTWTTTGSDWGGEQRLATRTNSIAAFVQDEVMIGSRVTLSPGVRLSRWTGSFTPCSAAAEVPLCRGTHHGVNATGVDPRMGISWDVTGRNTLAVKAHWGRYHQGLYSLFFDRVAGLNAYTNGRFYYTAPPISDSRATYSPAQRDGLLGPTGFSPFFDEEILNESGRSSGYRQPYVDQAVVGVEKSVGAHWKVELVGVARRNGDVVGLIDRNLARNYTLLRGVRVDHRIAIGGVLDSHGRPLVLDRLYVSNRDLIDAMNALNANVLPFQPPRCFAGVCPSDVAGLTYRPRLELAPLRDARRAYGQLTGTVTAAFPGWRAEGSLTVARLDGNVAGVTGQGMTASGAGDPHFTAGPFVRPNEAINSDGLLPDATEFEAKLWLTARLPWGMQGGMFLTHILGERTTPSFTILGRYTYSDAAGTRAPSELTRQVLGQRVFVESRGSRHYASRTTLDLHLERALPVRGASHVLFALDLFNALGSNAVIRVKTEIDDQALEDPSSVLGAPRQRVAPRSVRLGVRVE